MQITISGVSPKLKAQIQKYSFEVGILEDRQLKRAKPRSIKSFAGGPARQIGSMSRGGMQMLGAVLNKKYHWLRERYTSENKEIRAFANEYIAQISATKANMQRAINLVQAIVRNPILRGDYGSNSRRQARLKGFNRLMIDTGAFFGSIKARIIKNGN